VRLPCSTSVDHSSVSVIQDERWVRAMQAINDAVQVVGSKAYIRVYKRIGDTEKWEPLALDVAGV
jgi:hypothetical protein